MTEGEKADPFLRQTQDRRVAQDDHFLEDSAIRSRSYEDKDTGSSIKDVEDDRGKGQIPRFARNDNDGIKNDIGRARGRHGRAEARS